MDSLIASHPTRHLEIHDLFKFLDLLRTKELHFLLPEGRRTCRSKLLEIEQELLRHEVDPIDVAKNYENFTNNLFVNCWSKSNQESYAMWKVYLGGQPLGVAIKSSPNGLKKCLAGSPEIIKCGSVQYDTQRWRIGGWKTRTTIN